MTESIHRAIRGFSMLRMLTVATLLLVVACLIISASIALAAEPKAQPAPLDVYEFDFAIPAETGPDPEFAEPILFQDI